MSKGLEIRVPDIGDFDEVEVVEILVAKGDVVAVDARENLARLFDPPRRSVPDF